MSFIKDAVRTEAPVTDEVLERWKAVCRPMHGAIGLCTESGELQDAFKKHVYYGKPLDATNIKEELGDKFWYAALLCDHFGWTFEEIQEMIINKLRKRYPEKFTEHHALNRDLDAERKELETKFPERGDGQLDIFGKFLIHDAEIDHHLPAGKYLVLRLDDPDEAKQEVNWRLAREFSRLKWPREETRDYAEKLGKVLQAIGDESRPKPAKA